jgi:IclR family KDG regulon transcriptional repressor
MTAGRGNINKSVDRALRLLDLFGGQHVALTASEVAKLLGTTRVTIYPTLNTLLAGGYLDRDEQGRFVLGMKVVERGGEKLAQLDIRRVAQERLRDLARRLNANAHLATLHGNEVLYLEREEGRPAVTLREIVGRRVSPHCTALGKALIAFLPHEDRERLARSLDYVQHTPNTISNAEDFLAELDKVCQCGYALEVEEFHLSSACIAAPIRRLSGRVVGAISVSMAVSDLKAADSATRAAIVVAAAAAISSDLGHTRNSSENPDQGGDGRR